MTRKQRVLFREALMKRIGFLKWAKLDGEALDHLGSAGLGIEEVWISPDVNSLHIIWLEGDDVLHEVADYPDPTEEITFPDWLSEEIGIDSWEYLEGQAGEIYELLSDYGDVTAETIPTLTISDLAKIGDITAFDILDVMNRLQDGE